jgi:hypothetical protein
MKTFFYENFNGKGSWNKFSKTFNRTFIGNFCVGSQIIILRLYCVKVEKLFFGGKICLHVMMLNEIDLVFCEDGYVAPCTDLADSEHSGTFAAITN